MPASSDLISAPTDVQTFQEACDYLRETEEDVQDCLRAIREKGKELIVYRFRQGCVGNRATDMPRSEVYGESIVQDLAREAGISKRTLYRAMEFARHPQFQGSEARLRQWMTEKEEEKGRLTYSYCLNWTKKHLPEGDKEEAEEALEEQKDKLGKKATKLERSAEDLEQEALDLEEEVRRHNNGDADEAYEALGVATKAKEVAEDLRRQAERLKLKGSGRIESEEYLKHVREYSCLACGKDEADPHHLTPGGMGTKTHDLFTVPLCREHHQELHQIGALSFEKKHDLRLWRAVAYLEAEFITEIDLTALTG